MSSLIFMEMKKVGKSLNGLGVTGIGSKIQVISRIMDIAAEALASALHIEEFFCDGLCSYLGMATLNSAIALGRKINLWLFTTAVTNT